MQEIKNKRFTMKVPLPIMEALEKAVSEHNITMTKYVLRLLYVSLIKEGYLHDEFGVNRADIYIR